METLSWIFGVCPNVITRVFIRGRARVSKEEIGHMMMEAEVEVIQGRGHEPRNAGSLSKLEKARKWILPQSLEKDPF